MNVNEYWSFFSENIAALISATTVLYWLVFSGIAMSIGIHILRNMLFLSTSSHSLHLFKLLSSTFFLGRSCGWFLWGSFLRSNLILFLHRRLCDFLFCWRLLIVNLLLLLRSCLLIILGIILRLISWTYECGILIWNGLFWSISLVLVEVSWLLRLEPLLCNSLLDRLPNFTAVNIPAIRFFLKSKLLTVIYRFKFGKNSEIFT